MSEFSITVDTSALDNYIDRLKDAPELWEKHARNAMDGSLDLLKMWIADETPVNLGHLKGSWTTEITGTPVNLSGIVATPLIYGWPVEEGRKPGKWPPIQPIKMWAKRKLGLAGEELETAAFLIARKIGTVGTKGAHMVQQAYDRAMSGKEIDKIWKYEIDQLIKELER